ncbi:MAG TPA: hypothetical protein PKW75_00985 [candidate division Zixibacteria bacterium]|nr:hypothetical protein [candidate division Zixibacteria bacterium]MDD4917797.1 hypothetical protein [candidate division Zixibacteria bacterium]MDM7973905.1 hypothetical protein [candidate division Zixibacteria bacterium]HOD66107.1 hypothetical protein [candidate division Zixibacteria bacterium]HOZ06835.1 hypothetical protein [candidate division Zixibacteria bacterium]
MAKKKKAGDAPPAAKRETSRLNIEQSPWFTPVAFAIIFIGLVILFRDFIFSRLMLAGSDMIQAGIFFRSFLVDYYHAHGAVPRWNPYIFGGMPFVDAFHGDIFYPLSFLKYFGNIFRMLGWVQFWHIYLAGIFMYLAARQFRLSKIAALLAGVAYMFAPYLVSFVAPGHDGKMFVTALFPLTVYFLDRGIARGSFFDFSMLGLVIGFIVLSPHPQMSYFTLWALAAYMVFRLVFLFREKRRIRLLVRPAALTAYAVVIGLLLSAIQFYPGYTYTREFSPRADTKRGWEWATSWSLHEEEAVSLVIPEFAGVMTRGAQTFYWGKNAFKDNSEAVGAVTFFLALLGAFFARRREAYFFAGLALFALLYALADTTPVFRLFYWLIPMVKSLRAPSMIMFLFSFSAAMLAGMAVQRLRDARQAGNADPPGARFEWLLWGVPGGLFVLALLFSAAGEGMLNLWTSLFYSEAAQTQVARGVSKLDVAYRNLPAIQSGAWLAFVFAALAAALIWAYRSRRAGAAVLAVLVLVLMVDGIRLNSRFIEVMDPRQEWPENHPVAQFLLEQPGPFRVMNFSVLRMDLLPYYGIPVVTGYHGNQLRWYDDLLGGPGAPHAGGDRMPAAANPRFLNLVGARYLLVPGGTRLPDGFLGDRPVTELASSAQASVLQNDNAFPRAFLADRFRVVEDNAAIDSLVLHGDENLREIVYLEKAPGLDIPRDSLGADSVWFVDYQPDTVVLGLQAAANKLLVLTDNWYDAWQVMLDGRPAEILRADGSFRAVAVPAGTRAAMFVYKSDRYRLGKLVTVLTALFLAGVVVFQVVRTRRRRGEEMAA